MPASAARPTPPPVPQAAVEKIGQGDRAFLARDYRNALFAYQDAVYLAPRSAAARVRLGRAYLALRYPTQALAQGEQAVSLDPESADARQLVEEAKGAPARPAVPSSATAARSGTNGSAPAGGAGSAAPRVYKFDPEPAAPAAGAAAGAAAPASASASVAVEAPEPAPVPAAGGQPDPARAGAAAALAPAAADPAASDAAPASGGPTSTRLEVATARIEPGAPDPAAARGAAPAPGGPTAAQRYRTALEHLANREYQKADAELTQAIVLDPRLAVAYAARASARFGLARHRDAADDYQVSLSLDANLGTPLYGLAECYRVLGDPRRAAEMYQRYAESGAPDVREDLRAISAKRAQELR